MATSRTGTADWKKRRTRALRHAQRIGIETCKYCAIALDYSQGLMPNSAEVDHVESYSRTGRNDGELQVICRRCNQSKGNKPAPKANTVMAHKPLKTSRNW